MFQCSYLASKNYFFSSSYFAWLIGLRFNSSLHYYYKWLAKRVPEVTPLVFDDLVLMHVFDLSEVWNKFYRRKHLQACCLFLYPQGSPGSLTQTSKGRFTTGEITDHNCFLSVVQDTNINILLFSGAAQMSSAVFSSS